MAHLGDKVLGDPIARAVDSLTKLGWKSDNNYRYYMPLAYGQLTRTYTIRDALEIEAQFLLGLREQIEGLKEKDVPPSGSAEESATNLEKTLPKDLLAALRTIFSRLVELEAYKETAVGITNKLIERSQYFERKLSESESKAETPEPSGSSKEDPATKLKDERLEHLKKKAQETLEKLGWKRDGDWYHMLWREGFPSYPPYSPVSALIFEKDQIINLLTAFESLSKSPESSTGSEESSVPPISPKETLPINKLEDMISETLLQTLRGNRPGCTEWEKQAALEEVLGELYSRSFNYRRDPKIPP